MDTMLAPEAVGRRKVAKSNEAGGSRGNDEPPFGERLLNCLTRPDSAGVISYDAFLSELPDASSLRVTRL